MEPARKFDQPPRTWDSPSPTAPKAKEIGESGREITEKEIKIGKSIFYLTVAIALWFFYWLNGVQCPC